MKSFEEFYSSLIATTLEIWQAVEADVRANPGGRNAAIAEMDWPQLRSCAQELANDLMFCSDVESAIQMLRRDQAKLGAFAYLTTAGATQDQRRQAALRAYEDLRSESVVLPMSALCSFLTELLRETE